MILATKLHRLLLRATHVGLFVGACLALSAASLRAEAASVAIVHAFTGPNADGTSPWGGLVADPVGNLYGTTYIGGNNNNCPATGGCGTVFKITPAGVESIVYNFLGGAKDGSLPFGTLIIDGAGNLFGTTLEGGPQNVGTIFEITAAGHESMLYPFTGGVDGSTPEAALFLDTATKDLYGTTYAAGATGASGTFFKYDPTANHLTTLHSFIGTDGIRPHGEVIRDAAGNFYGTAAEGGDAAGDGTIWEYSAAGIFNVLHTFALADGSVPSGGLLWVGGVLLGTTAGGGANAGCSFNQVNGCGTIFSYDTVHAAFNSLHSFAGLDGMFPVSTLLLSPTGIITGTTFLGGLAFMDAHGDNTDGTLFQLFPIAAGGFTFQKIYDFDYIHGDAPNAGLCADPFGNLFGTAVYGGKGVNPGAGLVFKFQPSGQNGIFNGLQTNTYQARGPGPDSYVLTAGSGLIAGATVIGNDQNFELQPALKACIAYNYIANIPGVPSAGFNNGYYEWVESCDAPLPNGEIPIPNDIGTSGALFTGAIPGDVASGQVQFRRSGDYVQLGEVWTSAVQHLVNGGAAVAVALAPWLPVTASQVVVDVVASVNDTAWAVIDFPDPYNPNGGNAQGWFYVEGQTSNNPNASETLRTRLTVDWSTGAAQVWIHPDAVGAGKNVTLTIDLMGYIEPLRQLYASGDHEPPYTK